MLRISHKKGECIGCDHCTSLAPEYWRIDDNGLAILIAPTSRSGPLEFAKGFAEDRPVLDAAADGCPVQIIRID